jgi:hypothetical protein
MSAEEVVLTPELERLLDEGLRFFPASHNSPS